MHRTLNQETASPPELNLSRQQRFFDRFRHRYNDERAHEALGQVTPASHSVFLAHGLENETKTKGLSPMSSV